MQLNRHTLYMQWRWIGIFVFIINTLVIHLFISNIIFSIFIINHFA